MSELRMPPHSVESEHAVLGALLSMNSTWDLIDSRLVESDFFRANHRVIFATIGKLLRAAKPADVLTVAEAMKRAGTLDDAGGFEYLQSLVDGVMSSSNIRHYADIVKQRALLRQMIEVCESAVDQAAVPGVKEPAQLLDEVQQRLSRITEGQASDDLKGFVDILPSYVEMQEKRKLGNSYEIKTHLRDLDERIGGFSEGDLVIVGARPAMGKTGFMLHIAEANASMDYPVMVISLEMQATALKDRFIAKRARIPMDVVLGKRPRTNEQHDAILTEASNLVHLPIRFGDMMTLNIDRLRAMVRRAKRKYGIRLVMLDYLQLMEGSGEENRTGEISAITRGLKTLAVETRLPIVALAQLNRKLEERTNKRPHLADLRESGSIEQDADMILFLYRDEVYDEASLERGVAEIIIGKQRQGQVGTERAYYDGAFQAFRNLAVGYQVPERVAPIRGGFKPRSYSEARNGY